MSGSLPCRERREGHSRKRNSIWETHTVWKSGIFREWWEVPYGWSVGGMWEMRRDKGGRVYGGKDWRGFDHVECLKRHLRLCNGSKAHSSASLMISERTSGSVVRLELGRSTDRQLYLENNEAWEHCHQALRAYTWTFFLASNLWYWIQNMKKEK